MSFKHTLLAGIVLALGLAAAGYFIGDGLHRLRMADKYVSVKGLAEMTVKADQAVWSLAVSATGADLGIVQKQIESDTDKVMTFLTAKGFDRTEMKVSRTDVTDLLAREYRNQQIGPNRYIIRQTIMIKSDDVDRVAKVRQAIGGIVKQGVVLNRQENPRFIWNGLNEVKPDLIAKAIKNARESARRFAADSDAQVGTIRNANQGVIQIFPADGEVQHGEAASLMKKVRVVSTLQFYLED